MRVRNILIHNAWIKEGIAKRNRKYFELNENKNTRHQNLWDTAKANLGEKFIAVNTYVRKEGRSGINALSLRLGWGKGADLQPSGLCCLCK